MARSHTVATRSRNSAKLVGSLTIDPPVASTAAGVPGREQALEHVALEAPVVRLAVHRKHLAERQPCGTLDLAVDLDEAQAEALGERRPDRRLASATHAEQRNRARRVALFGRREQRDRCGAERARDLGEPA